VLSEECFELDVLGECGWASWSDVAR
jgi:hypothetical protein